MLGINDLKQLALPRGWDAGELAKYALADGVTYEQLVDNIIAGLMVANDSLMNDPILGSFISLTTETAIEYRDGTTGSMEERTEHAKADIRRGATTGHTLPLKSYDRALGWTFDFLRKARSAQLEADIADALYAVRDNWERQLLKRFFSTAENGIGSSGYDVPLINGVSSSVDFTPPPYAGQTFTSAHTHFDRKATTEQAAALNTGAKHLWEHGLFGPFNAVIPFADIETYATLTKFVKPDRGIEYVATGSSAPYAQAALNDERYIGLFESDYGLIRLWITPHLPTNYLGIYKPFGSRDPRNPLAVRYAKDLGPGAVLMRGEAFRQYPLEQAILIHEFGVGVGNRLNGYACYFAASGSYANPTIS
ncbi:MAG: hypothetical protein K8I82_23565 [Anaerolineae bacterium]|nr:hypothetical protein [Anaerolineae bacterium]